LGTTTLLALTPQEVGPLASDDFEEKSQALDRLISSGDPAVERILRAIQDDGLGVTGDNRVVVSEGELYRDAVDGAVVELSEVQPIAFNNRLRSKAAAGLAGYDLLASDRSTRAAAIERLFRSPDPSLRPLLEKIRPQEKDPALKSRLNQLWALTSLQDPDPQQRIEAAKVIGDLGNLQLRGLLAPLVAANPDGGFAEPDPKVRAAAHAALERLNFEQKKIEMIGTLFSGVSLGSILLLAALGLAITYGLIGVINMAHGEFLMIGAYATFVTQNFFRDHLNGWFDAYLVAAVPASFLAAAGVGFVLERGIIRFLYGRPLETLLTTFGISLLLSQLVRLTFGAQNVQVSNPSWMSGGAAVLPNLTLPYNRIAIILFALLVVGIASVVLNHTRLGLYVRAVTQNRNMAKCVGVKTWRVDSYAFAFGAGIAGLGGCALSQIANVGPDLGQGYIIDSFMAVVLGGVGQLTGTVVGAFGLGVMTKFIEPFWGAVLAKIAVLILIVLFIQKRPQGLFAPKGRSAET
jgi:urea transport system permease protein